MAGGWRGSLHPLTSVHLQASPRLLSSCLTGIHPVAENSSTEFRKVNTPHAPCSGQSSSRKCSVCLVHSVKSDLHGCALPQPPPSALTSYSPCRDENHTRSPESGL